MNRQIFFTAHQDYFAYFELSQSLGGAKMGDPEKKHLTTRKQNLACVTCDPSSNPHRDKTNKMACAPSEDSDQPGHPLI